MAWVRYRAFNEAGDEVAGRIEAGATQSALELLTNQGLIPFEVELESGRAKNWWDVDILGGDRMRRAETAIFARELATLVDAELPLDEALQSIADQAQKTNAGKLASTLKTNLHEGATFSASLEESDVFSPSHRSIIQAGEAGGALGGALTQVADFIERENTVRSNVQSALFYPTILLIMAGAAVIFILTILLPSLQPIFDDADASLPATTAALIKFGVFLKSNWAPLLLLLILMVVGVIYGLRQPDIRTQTDRLLLKAPVLGLIIAKAESANINRTLGMLLKNGVTMTNALQIVRAVAHNRSFVQAIETLGEDVKHGEAFLTGYERANVFPPLATRLAAAGDRSGKLDIMLLRSAEIFDEQVKRDIDQLVGLMTPVLTLSIGLLVGGLVISVLTAILSVNDLAF